MSDLASAIKQICEEKGLSYEAVLTTIESALSAAYRKDFGKKNQNIVVEFNPETAKSKVFDVKEVVEDMPEEEEITEDTEGDAEAAEKKVEDKKDEKKKDDKKSNDQKSEKEEDKAKKKEDEKDDPSAGSGQQAEKEDEEDKAKKKEEKRGKDEDESADEHVEEEEVRKFNPKTELQITDAKMIKKTAKIGDEIKMKLDPPEEYGRMAAQTAKQVIIQRLREAEREMIFNDFKDKEHEVVSGVVQRREGKIVLVDLGKAVGVLPPDEMINSEMYRSGDRIKVYVKGVSLKPKGPEILLSRTSDEILKKIFYLEIPEISNGLIEIKAVAREAGFRSKVAVWTDSNNVDPIGSCVGQRGARIQTVINELGGEKVDIISYDEDPVKFISNSLSPAKIISIDLNEEEMKARVKVSADQLSLAIGKGGQNARLAAKLTGWRVDIVEDDASKKEKETADSTDEDADSTDAKKGTADDLSTTLEAGADDKTDSPSTSSGQAADKKESKKKDEVKDEKEITETAENTEKDTEAAKKVDKKKEKDDKKKEKVEKKVKKEKEKEDKKKEKKEDKKKEITESAEDAEDTEKKEKKED